MEKNIDLRYYFETIKAYLIESTNIVPLFKKDGISLETFDIHKILLNIKGCSNDEILKRFLDGANNEYGIRKKFKKFNMNVIIYSNINYKLEKNPNFINALSLFDLELFKFEDFNFENHESLNVEIKNSFNHKFLMFKYNSSERDADVIKEKALNEINAFFGYVSYINNFNSISEKYSNTEFLLKYSLSDLKYSYMLLTDSNGEIYFPELFYEDVINSKSIYESKFVSKLKDFQSIDFRRHDKKNILIKLKYYFSLYYTASVEPSLENSFMKFWALSEKIIKDSAGQITDEKLVEFMEKIWNLKRCPEYMGQRIKLIKIKRNNFVHESKHGEIIQIDRNVLKIIAEKLISFILEYMEVVNNFGEYSIILQYSNMKNKERFFELVNSTDINN